MSTYEHDLLAARFAVLAPEPLPGNWDEVLERAGVARRLGRRVELPSSFRRRRRLLLVALAVVVLVAVATTAAFGIVRVFILDKGFVGLPPVGATPSNPRNGKLILSFNGRNGKLILSFNGRSSTLPLYRRKGTRVLTPDGLGPMTHVFVYADGRVIWAREGWVPAGANDWLSGFLEQRLTPDGVELLLSRVLSTSLFSDDVALVVRPPYGWGAIRARNGERLVTVRWRSASPFWDDIGPAATPEQERDLLRLDALLGDPAASLPGSAWQEREIRAYVPSAYATCWTHNPELGPDQPTQAIPPSRVLTLLPATVEDVLRRRGPVRRGHHSPPTDCSVVPTEEARAIAQALEDAGLEEGVVGNGIDASYGGDTYRFKAPDGRPGYVYVFFEPTLPHGEWICLPCG
jgi:hypothetical protein